MCKQVLVHDRSLVVSVVGQVGVGYLDRQPVDVLPQHITKRAPGLAVDEPNVPRASTFTDRATAERAIAEALDANADEITTWLSGNTPQLRLYHTADGQVGTTLLRGADEPVSTDRVFVLLRRDPTSPLGYRIHTSYPDPPAGGP